MFYEFRAYIHLDVRFEKQNLKNHGVNDWMVHLMDYNSFSTTTADDFTFNLLRHVEFIYEPALSPMQPASAPTQQLITTDWVWKQKGKRTPFQKNKDLKAEVRLES